MKTLQDELMDKVADTCIEAGMTIPEIIIGCVAYTSLNLRMNSRELKNKGHNMQAKTIDIANGILEVFLRNLLKSYASGAYQLRNEEDQEPELTV